MNLNLMTVSELRKLAAQFGIAGRSTMKKVELIAALSDPDIADFVALSVTVDKIDDVESIEDTMQAITNAEADAECERARRLAEYDTEDEAAYIEEGLRADADAGTYTLVNEVAILRDAPGRAIVTAAFNGTTVGGSIVRKGKRLVLTAGKVTVSATSFEKVAKLLAQRLGFFAEHIEIVKAF